jgi:hypothetical protein
MSKSIGVLEKVTLLLAADSSIPLAELVVVVAGAAGADAVVDEEEVAEAAQAPQRHRHIPQTRRLQSMHMARKSRQDGGNTTGQPHNNLLLMDTILANTRTPHQILHGRILKIWLCTPEDLSTTVYHTLPDTNMNSLRLL